ncbi:MAG: TRAP transporter small permease [Siculibacillus sp.]|nr:TRAP transporter small permease [Siculibacillus sp.]
MLRLLDRLEEAIIAFLIGAATLIIFAAVVHRYGLGFMAKSVANFNAWGLPAMAGAVRTVYKTMAGINMTWAQELTIYMFVWMAKFGAAYGVRTGIHVGVDVLINQMQARARVGFILFGLLAGALFTGIVGLLGANFVWHMFHTDQTSADLEVPMWLVYLCVPIGSWLMSFRFLQVAVSYWKTGQLPKHDHGHVAGLDEEGAKA